jgi:hypothetical protein
MGYVAFDGAPGRRRQLGDFGEQLGTRDLRNLNDFDSIPS